MNTGPPSLLVDSSLFIEVVRARRRDESVRLAGTGRAVGGGILCLSCIASELDGAYSVQSLLASCLAFREHVGRLRQKFLIIVQSMK
jgi:hypothetical protein